mmetsp:Transcript_26601/g.55402  ORF Transcript_26601/g.55402 Transcript_26601/m.55402 type:complete len:302 (+) Transcript_26601:522-1427(+)
MPDTDLLAESSLRIELGDAARVVGVASLLRRGLGDGRLREEARPVTAVELSPCCCESPFPGVENFPFGVSPSTLVGADAGRRLTALRGGIDLGGALLLVLLVPPDGEASSRTPVRTNLPMTPSSSHSASTSSLIFVNCFISLPAAANTLSAAPLILSQEIIAQYIFFPSSLTPGSRSVTASFTAFAIFSACFAKQLPSHTLIAAVKAKTLPRFLFLCTFLEMISSQKLEMVLGYPVDPPTAAKQSIQFIPCVAMSLVPEQHNFSMEGVQQSTKCCTATPNEPSSLTYSRYSYDNATITRHA